MISEKLEREKDHTTDETGVSPDTTSWLDE